MGAARVSDYAIAVVRLRVVRAHSKPEGADAASTRYGRSRCCGARPGSPEKSRWLFHLVGATLCARFLVAASRLIPRPPQAPIERICDLLSRPRPADERACGLPRRVHAELSRCPNRPASRPVLRAPSPGAFRAVRRRSEAAPFPKVPLRLRSARGCRERHRRAKSVGTYQGAGWLQVGRGAGPGGDRDHGPDLGYRDAAPSSACIWSRSMWR